MMVGSSAVNVPRHAISKLMAVYHLLHRVPLLVSHKPSGCPVDAAPVALIVEDHPDLY
jgi:hypothetical protein